LKNIKTFLRKAGIFPPIASIYHAFVRFLRQIFGVDKKIIERYLKDASPKKLHIGCGDNHLEGWLNTDIYPKKGEAFLDATKAFRFSSDTYDYIFSEHMIEHIPYQSCLNFLAECYRILKPGGTIRLATPDLKFLIDLYNPNKSDIQIEYMKWSVGKSIKDVKTYADAFVINKFMHNWGHTFIYDEKTLKFALKQTGFVNVTKQNLSISADPELNGLEYAERLQQGFLELESLILEAIKPSGH
jgi:predicted SAM-dependent methyltransferase